MPTVTVDPDPTEPSERTASRPARRAVSFAALRDRRAASTGAGRRRGDGDIGAAELNRLLRQLDDAVAPGTAVLDRREVLDVITNRLNQAFSPSVTCLLELDDRTGEWVAKIAGGCVLPPTVALESLPAAMQRAIERRTGMLVGDLNPDDPGLAPGSGTGIYLPLLLDDRVVGALALEHAVSGRYAEDDLRRALDLGGETALLIDNARRYARLRLLGADASEARVTRELHDRLGQWLTFVSFELESVIRDQAIPSAELTRLYATVQAAIEEMRDTLRQVLAGVATDRPLSRVAEEICARFEERTEIATAVEISQPLARLAVPIELELSRILQEALANCERHADAASIDVIWDTDGDVGTLTVTDDGVGFDLSRGVRDGATGLVDMRERADAIGARLDIRTEIGKGTTVEVTTTTTTKERQC